MNGRNITYGQLDAAGACEDYRGLFSDRFPTGEVLLTVELAVEQAKDWDWDWAAEYLLSYDGWQAYNAAQEPSRAVYRDAVEPASKALRDARVEGIALRDKIIAEHPVNALGYHERAAWNAAYIAQNEFLAPFMERERDAYDAAIVVFRVDSARHFAELFIKEGESDSE